MTEQGEKGHFSSPCLDEFGLVSSQGAHLHLPTLPRSAKTEQGFILPRSAHPCGALASSPSGCTSREAAGSFLKWRHVGLVLHPSSACGEIRAAALFLQLHRCSALLLPSEAFYRLVHFQQQELFSGLSGDFRCFSYFLGIADITSHSSMKPSVRLLFLCLAFILLMEGLHFISSLFSLYFCFAHDLNT